MVNDKNENFYRCIITASLNNICTGFLLLSNETCLQYSKYPKRQKMSFVPSSYSKSSFSQSIAQIGLSLRSISEMPMETPSLSAKVGSRIYSTQMAFDGLDRNLVNLKQSVYERSPQIAEVGSSCPTSSSGSPTHKSDLKCTLLLVN